MNIRSESAIQLVKSDKTKYDYNEIPYLFISIPSLYQKDLSPDSDLFYLIETYENEFDIVIVYPHYATDEERQAYSQLALDLSSDHKVLLYEASIEAGGGAEVLDVAKFAYQQFQPIIDVTTVVLLNVLSNYVYDVLTSLYKNKNNPILKSQFTIRRQVGSITYNYIFDKLTADEAIAAGKMIPKQIENVEESSFDVYLAYLPSKGKWIEVKI